MMTANGVNAVSASPTKGSGDLYMQLEKLRKLAEGIAFGFLPAAIIFMTKLMVSAMVRLFGHLKVAYCVFGNIFVSVMDYFRGKKFSSKMFFHHKTMLQLPVSPLIASIGNLYKDITTTGSGFSSYWLLLKPTSKSAPTSFRASFNIPYLAWNQFKRLVAGFAPNHDSFSHFRPWKFSPVHILIIISILILSSSVNGETRKWNGNGDLYSEISKSINGGWTLSAPVLETTITKAPLLIDFEGRMDYTMKRGGSTFNHHSVRGELHTGVYNGPWWATFSVGLIGFIEGNDDGIPAGIEGINTLRLGVSF